MFFATIRHDAGMHPTKEREIHGETREELLENGHQAAIREAGGRYLASIEYVEHGQATCIWVSHEGWLAAANEFGPKR